MPKNDYEGAVREFQRAIELATQMLSRIMAKDDPENSLELLVAVVKSLPDHPQNAMTKLVIRQMSH